MPFDPEAPYPPPRRRPQPVSPWSILFAIAFGFLLGGAVLWWLAPHLGRPPAGPALNPEATERPADPKSALDAEEREAVNVFKNARDSVVNVDTLVFVRTRLDMRVQEQQTGTGSGFVWDDDGRVVTNYHVVREAVEKRQGRGLRVVMADRTAWEARVVGVSAESDLAVVQIGAPKDKLKKIRVGSSHDLEVGQKVFAIGNPFGLSLSMTQGIVSALDREIESPGGKPITGAIQIDAPINPGNSGGPLLDKDGRLVGVNTAITSPSGGNVGIGFAIPVETVNPVVTDLIQHGRALRPDIGVRLVDQPRVRRAGFPAGVMVLFPEPGGPAAKAGLRGVTTDPDSGDVEPGDLIVAADGEEVRGNQEFARMVGRHKIGDKLKLTVERDGKRSDVEVTVRGV